MQPVLTFIVPVRHQENASNWSALKSDLSETMKSIAAQTHPCWQAVVVANEGADLPSLPSRTQVVRVTLPPNPAHDIRSNVLEEAYEAMRLDKGFRILAGLRAARQAGHVMVVDADDFISRDLTAFVASNRGATGWWVRDGYIWPTGGSMLYSYRDFSQLCGTSHIIRADLYKTGDLSEEHVKRIFGSHKFLQEALAGAGSPLAPLPFHGAVYRIGHDNSHSRSSRPLRTVFANKHMMRYPAELAWRIVNSRPMSSMRTLFFGD